MRPTQIHQANLFPPVMKMRGWDKIGAALIAQLVKNLPAMQETLVRILGQKDPLEKAQTTHTSILGLPLGLKPVKSPHATQETWVMSLGWEGMLEKGKVIHFSILAWRIPWTV